MRRMHYFAALAFAFAASLRARESLIEAAVRALVPAAPDFVGGYCRGLTRFWAAFFAASAALGAGLAVFGPLEWWRAWTGWGNLAAMLLVSGPEFLIRKTWFRYYFHGGPFDRVWSRLFPAVGLVDGRAGIEKVLKQIEKCASKQGALGSGWRVNGLIMAMGAAAENGDCDLLAALKKRGGSERDLRAMGNLPECR